MNNLLQQIYSTLLKEYGYRNKWFGDSPDEIIIGAILVQNTNWLNVEKAISNLKTADLVNLQTISQMQVAELIPYIKPAGFHNQKAPRLISIAQHLCADKLPTEHTDLRNYLLSLRGLGPETVDCLLLYVFGHPYFVIDAYTIRVFSRLGLCKPDAKYHSLQSWFMDNLSADVNIFKEYHALLIKLAKTACLKQPRCSLCPLSALCEYHKQFQSHD